MLLKLTRTVGGVLTIGGLRFFTLQNDFASRFYIRPKFISK
jgi:hypothetical protein